MKDFNVFENPVGLQDGTPRCQTALHPANFILQSTKDLLNCMSQSVWAIKTPVKPLF